MNQVLVELADEVQTNAIGKQNLLAYIAYMGMLKHLVQNITAAELESSMATFTWVSASLAQWLGRGVQ